MECPMRKFSESPAIHATKKKIKNNSIFRLYCGLAASAAAAKSNESPGRKGVITAPVSIKTMANKITYDQPPKVFTIDTM